MLAPWTVYLHGISGGISLFIFLWIEVVFRRRSHAVAVGQGGGSPASHYFAWWFLFFALYHFLLALPLALSQPFEKLNTFYTLALVSLFLGSFYIIRVPFDTLFVRAPGMITMFSAALVAVIIAFIALQFMYPVHPFLNPSETLLIWNPHPIAAMVTTWSLIGVALTFAVTFIVGAFRTKNRLVRIRSVFFAAGAILLALSAKYYYEGKIDLDVLMSFAFGIGGLAMLALGLMLVEVIKRFSRKSMLEKGVS